MLGLFTKSFGVVNVLFLSIMVATLGSNFSSEKPAELTATRYTAMSGSLSDLARARPVDRTDSLALVAFYEVTDGGNWTIKRNWLTGAVASWYGVTVTNGRVTRLELPNNNVRYNRLRPDPNQLPPEIGDLAELEILDLAGNNFNAGLPAEIGNLVKLKELNLAGNKAWGDFRDIFKLIQLEKLNLSGNQLGTELPAEIGNLIYLKELDLHGLLSWNPDSRAAIPAEILNLTQLEVLILNDNNFGGLPDLSPLDPVIGNGVLSTVVIDNNAFTFEDIEPNVSLSFAFSYATQALKGLTEAYEGDLLTLYIPVGGAFSQYQWYKDGIPINGATSERYEVGPVTRDAAGAYELEAKNTLVTDLVLRSSPYEIEYIEEYTSQWLDIGAYHHAYSESGARHGGSQAPEGMEYPAILRHSGHIRSEAFWIGIKDWADLNGKQYPYYVAHVGPNEPGSFYTYPIQNKLIGRYEDTVVEVNGEPSFDNEAMLDEIDPNLAADRMLHNVHNMSMGISVDRKIYAYTNEYHDNYHVIKNTYCNTGNIDDDEEIELPDQTLHDVIFYRINRWRGAEQATSATSSSQSWGRYTLHDVVGDGYEEYPVDFTAQYAWTARTIDGYSLDYSNLGGPLLSDVHEYIAPGDSIGRLSGATMMGNSVIHADLTATDSSYDQAQPAFMSWIWNDSEIYMARARDNGQQRPATHEELYEQGIVSPPVLSQGLTCTDCRRAYPHMADLDEPGGLFWDPSSVQLDLTGRTAGGYSATTGYGPYEMGPGECVNITVSEGIAGLSFDAATKIGQTFKRAESDRNAEVIAYDANGDGAIDTAPFDYDNVFVGTEAQTKDQWVMSARDSLFQTFYRAQDLYAASNKMTVYPIVEPPRPPIRFSLWSRSDHVELNWTHATGGPKVSHWELYRTEHWEDNLYVNGCLEDAEVECGYERVATLPAEATSYADADVSAGIDYFYYIQGVGETQSEDPDVINGTPGGVPLRSGRYLTQTYTPVALQTSTATDNADLPGLFSLDGNYPNPFRRETRILYAIPAASDVELIVYDMLGREVKVLAREYQAPGRYEYSFSGQGLASGVYIYVLQAGEHKAEGKMLVVH